MIDRLAIRGSPALRLFLSILLRTVVDDASPETCPAGRFRLVFAPP